MEQKLYDSIEANPIIAAVKDMNGLNTCCGMDEIKVVFVLFGDICNIGGIVQRLKDSGKTAMVHIDLISGLNSKEISVNYIKQHTAADGIISTKPALIKQARELSMHTILRAFALDSMAFENIDHQLSTAKPDAIEILPGLMPKVIKKLCKNINIPVIAGGLISEKEDVIAALSAGALAISTTNVKIWKL